MSRTPLFRLLQRSYRAASYSVARSEPVDELLDRRDEIRVATSTIATTQPMSRRQFVAGSVVADRERVFPGASATRAGMKEVRFQWQSFPWTKGSYASYVVGQRTSFGGAEGGAVEGLHFVGEHCSCYAQGFMEGGCETGETAAQAVAQPRGKRIGLRSRWEPRRLAV
jgi:hypothetical protein